MKPFEIGARRYLGSKSKLVEAISSIAHEYFEGRSGLTFCDAFAGTGVVGAAFLKRNFEVHFNDILSSNTMIHRAFTSKDAIDANRLDGLIARLNSPDLVLEENYFSQTFEGTYFNRLNAIRIGAIREEIERLYLQGSIHKLESEILITSLIYAADKIAHTVGHYDAFRPGVGLSQKQIELRPLSRITNHIGSTYSSVDANDLVRSKKFDLIYLDPPYNSRQYSDMYHVIENLALWEKPEVFFKARKMDRRKLKSSYSTNSALPAFTDLIENSESKVILFSYNDTGADAAGRSAARLQDGDILELLRDKGRTQVIEIPHQAFQTGKSSKSHVTERLFICDTRRKATRSLPQAKKLETVSSPLNYIGGKKALIPSLRKEFGSLKEFTLVDAFAGGLSVSLNIDAGSYVINDASEIAISLSRYFYDFSPAKIEEMVDSICEQFGLSNTSQHGYEYYGTDSSRGVGLYNKSKYAALRDYFNKKAKWDSREDEVAHLFTLVIFSFNNQIRFNSSGEWNMPVGKRDFNSSSRRNLYEASRELQRMNPKFILGDFSEIPVAKTNNPFVYCDPPYLLGLAPYNEKSAWTEVEESRLLEWLTSLHAQNIPFALSNVSQHKGMTNLLLQDWVEENSFNAIPLAKNYKNSNYRLRNSESKTIELLVTNYEIVEGAPVVIQHS